MGRKVVQTPADEIEVCLSCPLPECMEPSVREDWTVARWPMAWKGQCPWVRQGYDRREKYRRHLASWREKRQLDKSAKRDIMESG